MDVGTVILDLDGPVAQITISNEARRNAMSLAMWQQLGEQLSQLGDDVRCLVLQGAGDKAFVAGADISEFRGSRRSPVDVEHYDGCAEAAMNALHDLSIPTIAKISGFCIGGGMALALCCDVRLAEIGSQFAIPAARLGLGYGATNIKHLLDAVSVPVATDMLVSARRFSAEEALQMGLVNRIYPPDQFAAQVGRYVADIARNAPLTVQAAKRTIRELTKIRPDADLALCKDLIAACFASEDYLEGMTAFAEKREPQFKGR